MNRDIDNVSVHGRWLLTRGGLPVKYHLTNIIAIKCDADAVEAGAARSPCRTVCAVVAGLNQHILARFPDGGRCVSQLLERIVLIRLQEQQRF